MENFTPWSSLAGGALLGCSAVILLLYSGKTAGISGIFSGLLMPKKGEFLWRFLFILGMIISFYLVTPFTLEIPNMNEPTLLYVIAGLLVGFGTKMGNGCTSGHGIIGIGRLSKRSIIATLTFIATAAAIVFFRGLLGDL